jgi:SDR family mycofactocin-dependent oxidoreductase
MPGRVAGKVAFITGAARGQGRSHALRLAEEGADVIAIDICAQIDSVPYAMATTKDLAETVAQVRALGRRAVSAEVDVRDEADLHAALSAGVAELGRLDIVSANAGIASYGRADEVTESTWHDVIDTNLMGAWNTARVSIPHLIEGERGGSIIITSSAAGLRGHANAVHYVSSKHALVGLMRSLALELAPHGIRVNSLHPCSVRTPMLHNDAVFKLFRPDLERPTLDDTLDIFASLTALPVPWVESIDISNALLFLASDEARYITGVTLPIDAGELLK